MSFNVQNFSSSTSPSMQFSATTKKRGIPPHRPLTDDSHSLKTPHVSPVAPHFGKGNSSKKYYKGSGQILGLFSSWMSHSFEKDVKRYNSRDVFHVGRDRRGMHHYDIYESRGFQNDDGRYGGYAFSRVTHRTPQNYFSHRR